MFLKKLTDASKLTERLLDSGRYDEAIEACGWVLHSCDNEQAGGKDGVNYDNNNDNGSSSSGGGGSTETGAAAAVEAANGNESPKSGRS